MLVYICSLTVASGQEVIMLSKYQSLQVSLNGHQLSVFESNHVEKKFLENVNYHSRDYVYYSDLDPITSFEAYTELIISEKKSKKIKPKVIETKDIVEPSIFYGGHKLKEFVYPLVEPGAIGVLKHTKQIKDPHIIGAFYFDSPYDTEVATYSISFPKEVTIEYNLFNTEGLEVDFVKTTGSSTNTYTWKMTGLKKRPRDSDAPSRSFSSPHIIARIGSYTVNDKTYKISADTDDLFNWYNSLIHRMPFDVGSHNVTEIAKELTRDAASDKEKTEIIYQWVQSNIKYIAFEDGMAGFIPRAAGDVLAKKYGDCKDMANLLTTMLNAVDVPAYLTWIGTNRKPYSYKEVPSTVSDNHMICAIRPAGQDYIFLDPTNSFLRYGKPPKLVQGKEALIRLGNDAYDIAVVPESEAEENLRVDQMNLTLSSGVLSGDVESTFSGYQIEDFKRRKIIHEYRNETNFIQEHLAIGEKSSTYIDPTTSESNDELKVKFEGQFKNDVIAAGDKLYVNLNLDPSTSEFQVKDLDTRVCPIQKNYKSTYQLVSKLTIPEGYEVYFLPENVDQTYDDYKISTSYTMEQGQVIYEKTVTSNYLLLDQDSFDEYNSFYTELLKTSKQKITLKKI